jgi:hypothetical protein
MLRGFRLAQLPVSARLAVTCFIVLIGFGYLVSLAHLFFTYSMKDGKPGLTADDLRIELVGNREKTLLESKLVGGSMEQYLTDPAERKIVLDWIHGGGKEAGYSPVQAVFAKRCIGCHSPNGQAKFRPLTNYTEVAAVIEQDRGESPAAWARVAHIHLQSLGTIFLCLGLLFAFAGLPEWIKAVLVPMPFLALVLDFGARALTPQVPVLVYVVMLGGALGAFSTFALLFGLFWELWLARPGRPDRRPVQELQPAPQS